MQLCCGSAYDLLQDRGHVATPDYWASLLWKRLMGGKVRPPSRAHIHIGVSCTGCTGVCARAACPTIRHTARAHIHTWYDTHHVHKTPAPPLVTIAPHPPQMLTVHRDDQPMARTYAHMHMYYVHASTRCWLCMEMTNPDAHCALMPIAPPPELTSPQVVQ